MPDATLCPVCRSVETRSFYTQHDVPCQDGVIWASREEAQAAPRGDIELVHCRSCGHVFNCRFDPARFVADANRSIAPFWSPADCAFIEDLARGLVERHGLRGKTVIEIGSGRGEFLKSICTPYGNHGIGFDPTAAGDALTDADREWVRIEKTAFVPTDGLRGDLLVLRVLLQSTLDPRAFLADVHKVVSAPAGVAYAEVPNSAHVFEKLGIWNIVYERGHYFGRTSLTTLFAESGFSVQDCYGSWLGDQRLGLEAGVTAGAKAYAFDPAEVERFSKVIDRFSHEHQHKIVYWRNTLDRLQTQGKRLAMWGAGGRAQSFCNLFELNDSLLPYIVDINPSRQGQFMPKTLQQVVAPEQLKMDAPDVILITNSGYAAEIKKEIGAMGLRSEVLVLD